MFQIIKLDQQSYCDRTVAAQFKRCLTTVFFTELSWLGHLDALSNICHSTPWFSKLDYLYIQRVSLEVISVKMISFGLQPLWWYSCMYELIKLDQQSYCDQFFSIATSDDFKQRTVGFSKVTVTIFFSIATLDDLKQRTVIQALFCRIWWL